MGKRQIWLLKKEQLLVVGVLNLTEKFKVAMSHLTWKMNNTTSRGYMVLIPTFLKAAKRSVILALHFTRDKVFESQPTISKHKQNGKTAVRFYWSADSQNVTGIELSEGVKSQAAKCCV